MDWIILLKIISWIPIGLEVYIIARNLSCEKWKKHQGKMELIAWIVALSASIFNAIWICMIAEW